MNRSLFSPADLTQIRAKGTTEETALAQLEIFRRGQSFASLSEAARTGNGILKLTPKLQEALLEKYAEACAQGRAMQFVPASGAATRLFKSLLAKSRRRGNPMVPISENAISPADADEKEFSDWIRGLHRFPFHAELKRNLAAHGKDFEDSLRSGDYRPILEGLLGAGGLGYGKKPKALIPFHAYPDGNRTALEEHLAEARKLVRDSQGICRLHFTVSPEHRQAIETALREAVRKFESKRVRFQVEISGQDPATDTLAADDNGEPARNPDGTLVFRPGGHGALLKNLSECGGDIVFIKNIDNVVPDAVRADITSWRRTMGGLLVQIQSEIFRLLGAIRASPDESRLENAVHFLERDLGVRLPPHWKKEHRLFSGSGSMREFVIALLDRPVRVCAMVENRGEPGGGPFWVRYPDGSTRLQIVETPQIDRSNPAQMAIANSSSYFNPTDMVCGLRDVDGMPFQLQEFRDPDAGFITVKSGAAGDLRALELPGLWNGSMAFWNTIFVEAPSDYFNPVKSVNDLLRPAHLNANT